MRTVPAPAHSIGPSAIPSGSDVVRLVRASLDSMSADLPICPTTAIKLLQLTRNPDVEFRDVVALMNEDPVVAARVLSTAQSAFHSRGASIVSLRDAAVRLGLRELAHIFLEITASVRIFRAKGFEGAMNGLKRHSSATAQISRVICHHTGVDESMIFISALLHDVGVAFAAAAVGTLKNAQTAWPGIMAAHAEVGRLVCEAWKLPAEVAPQLGAHHEPFVEGDPPSKTVIVVADWMAARVGIPSPNEPLTSPPIQELRSLGIAEPTFDRICMAAEEIAKHVR
jgi:HD-like signal output (HDOD) protein